jgi:murein DD-endopeptidase MepM/ murein hydrolase activator NlpD
MAARPLRFEHLEGRDLLAYPYPWHNATREFDVTNDGRCTPQDALAVIDYINAFGTTGSQVPSSASLGEPYGFIDSYADNIITARDALSIINAVNARLTPPQSTFTLPDSDVREDDFLALAAAAPFIGTAIDLALEHDDGQIVHEFDPVTLTADGEIPLHMPRALHPDYGEDGYKLRISHAGEVTRLGFTLRRGLHPANDVTSTFLTAFGRTPAPVNIAYWQSRTDISPLSLLKAMQDAKLEYEASLPKIELYAFRADGQEIPSPSGVAEGDPLQARFANIPVGEAVSVHFVYNGVIRQTSTAVAGVSGTANLDIRVPSRLLPELFSGTASGFIDILLVQGDQAQHRTLTLREGPRLLIKSAEATEGEYMYFAVRGVKADEPVYVTVRYDWGSGSRDQQWSLGKTNGSNYLEPSNSKLLAPVWLRPGHQEDGIEVDIRVGDDTRGYRVTLKKGSSRDDIIANLIRTNGTGSIEAELSVLLSEDERILADQLIGDDWEGNAAAIGNALEDYKVLGGGHGGDLYEFLEQFATNASQALISTLIPQISPTGSRWPVFQSILALFTSNQQIDHHNAIESGTLPNPAKTPTGWYYPLASLTPNNTTTDRNFGACGDDDYFPGVRHTGADIITGEIGTPVYATGPGKVLSVSPKGWGDGKDGNVALLVKHSSDHGDFIAIYGHIRTTLKAGDPVFAGKVIGTVGPWPTGIHLHFGIHPGVTIADPEHLGRVSDPNCSNPGYTNGFVRPLAWINTSKPAG